MIVQISGTILACTPTSTTVLVQGIGLKVFTPPLTYTSGAAITLYTHLAVRENALDLYGFIDALALTVFELLLTVPKVGPKSALQIMSGSDPSKVIAAILEADPHLLKTVAGIGGKTGENIIAHLKDKVSHLAKEAASPLGAIERDAVEALISLGFDSTVARARVSACPPTDDVTTLIKAALATKTE